MKETFRSGFKERIQPKVDPQTRETVVEPFRDAQLTLFRGEFAKKERDEFFNDAFTDILTDLFTQWLKSEPHCVKEREFLYHTALALGSVKGNLINRETLGKNAAYIQKTQAAEDADKND